MSKIATSLPNAVIAVDRSRSIPLYRQLYDQLRSAILSGRLAPGTRLPSTRELAGELNIARNTVLNTFEQLYAESYLERRVGDGTYVSPQLPDDLLRVSKANSARSLQKSGRSRSNAASFMAVSVANYSGPPRPFRTGTPAFDAFPYKLWGRLLTKRWSICAPEILQYSDSAGYLPLRKAIASYVSTTRGVRCVPEQLIITSGSQHALEIVIRTVLKPSDNVWMEDPGFLGARASFIAAGAHLVPVPVDAEGLNIASGMERCSDPRLIYVTPSHQYPLGSTLSLSRRLALVKLAARCSAWVIEDDYDSEFRYVGRPLAALQGLDTGQRVIYVGTLSKVLFPSVRIGYIIAPPDLFEALLSARCLGGHQSPTLEQAVLADFITEGHFARHIRRMRVLYAERQQALVNAAKSELEGLLEIRPSDAGMHLLGWLPEPVVDRKAFRAATAAGVEVTPLSAYCIEPRKRGALRLGYTGYKPREIWRATRRLAQALRNV
ncbi:MAG TPA: PLP-dependent aminotransferase family protein [Pyrinomonadaceae bacterium]|jgi:GntR family transcriptional regulator/MocR family aminotransferase|nr:PLP-dependent aminotransferase family protein [Pyrinomonadaceae bacterium]